MEARSSDKQVIDEYTLSDENRIIIFTHSLDDMTKQLKDLAISLRNTHQQACLFRDNILKTTKPESL